MTIDVARVRAETRAAETVVHLNNAGSSLPPAIVMDTVHEQLRADEVFGPYEAQALAEPGLALAYESVAELVGGAADEVAFFGGATHAWQTGLYSLPWRRGDRILASQAEYGSNVYAFAYLKERFGVRTDYVPDDERGQIDVDALAESIDDKTRLVAVTHIPTYGGLVNPVAQVGAVARAAGVLFLLDACQSVGHMRLNVTEIGCDLLSGAGRKYLRGPRGTGFLWANPRALDQMRPAHADQHSQTWSDVTSFTPAAGARRLETFERSVALQLGLGAAARYALSLGTSAIEARVCALAAALRGMLAEIPGVTIQDRGERLSGIVTFTVEGFAAEEVRVALRENHINTWVVGRSMSMRDFAARGIDEVTRASVHYFNTEDELACAADVVRTLTA
jgi:selenocysteine lyase/cysteine desulfurase